MQDLVFKLVPHAVITGRVVDADGEPVAYVQVQPMLYRYNNGCKQLAPAGFVTTNDLGECRLFGLAPGRYYLRATPRADFMVENSTDRSANPTPEEGLVDTYYPGTTDPASAGTIELAPGA